MAYGPGKDSVPEMTTKTRDMHEKLDTDFMYFLTNPHLQLRLLPSPQDRKNAQVGEQDNLYGLFVRLKTISESIGIEFITMGDDELIYFTDWLQRLVGWMPEDVASKRERNVYLSRLIQGIQEGVLTGIFAKPPQRGLLKPTKEVFDVMSLDKLMEVRNGDERIDPAWAEGGANGLGRWDDIFPGSQACFDRYESPYTQVEGDTVEDLHVETELDMRQLTSKSKDGRTYLATRTLPNGEGIFGYVAVSIGGGDSQWIDPDRRRKMILKPTRTYGIELEVQPKDIDRIQSVQSKIEETSVPYNASATVDRYKSGSVTNVWLLLSRRSRLPDTLGPIREIRSFWTLAFLRTVVCLSPDLTSPQDTLQRSFPHRRPLYGEKYVALYWHPSPIPWTPLAD
ncbi:hypothetical protein AAG570_007397 [Ranatra chinensis]|uniref:DUF4485 domain-containing protein n=1 Tax=Ranatra chinensis TaxID=642074 RepID=A0ABD0XVQ8_9HEMI